MGYLEYKKIKGVSEMKKKAIEQLAERRLIQIEALEAMMRMRKQKIKELESDKKGLEEVISLLEAIIFSSVEKNGRLEVKKSDIAEFVRVGYKIRIEEDVFIIEKVE